MRRLVPSSLFGQVLASVALALLVAQIVSAILLYRAGEDRRETAILATAAFQLVAGAERLDRQNDAVDGAREGAQRSRPIARNRTRGAGRPGREFRNLPRPLRYTVSDEPPVGPAAEGSSEERLRAALEIEGITPHAAQVRVRRAGDDPLLIAFAAEQERFQARDGWRSRNLIVAAIQREAGAEWETARVLERQLPRSPLGVLVLQTLVTFLVLLVVLFLVLRRITRPLARLTDRVNDFSRQPDQAITLDESGPADTRLLIAAHNMMEARIAALLDEKDVMLGAIGHDLKTPLAALRVRIESVSDAAQRAKMADSIEDITATLDDILSLSRVGRDGADIEPVDLGALASSIAEEFEDLGEPVTIADPPRLVADVQVTWIKRALRNLVSNAVRYGDAAEMTLLQDDDYAILRVEDRGPGIPEEEIAAMLEPFTRGEASRNRATGGAGLGLTLTRAIAQQHGGSLVLRNRNEGGLRAELKLPT